MDKEYIEKRIKELQVEAMQLIAQYNAAIGELSRILEMMKNETESTEQS